MKLTKLLMLLLLLSLKGIAQTPTFGNTGAITLCVNGSYYLNPSTTDGTFSTTSPTIAIVNSSGYVTGVATGTSIVSLVTSGGTVTATITVGSSSGLSITDPLAQSSYKFNNNPQGPVGGLNNYVGYNGFSYSSQARPIKTGYFRASNQSGNNAGCPYEYYIFRCTTCGTVTEYAIRPQGTFVGNNIQPGSNGQLTFTSSNSPVGGPFTIVYLPSGGINVTVTGKSSGQAIPLGTITSSKSYNLISVTDENTKATTDFSGTIATVSVIPPSALLSGSTSICSGTTANLSLSTAGTGSITVTLNNGTVFNTVSGTSTISVSPTINTTYTISSVIDTYSSGTSTGSATVSIYAPASITVQPMSSATIIEGATTTLSVTATGQPILNYQWYKDGSAISGANSYSYTTTNTTSAAGTYYVTVSTTCNVVSSTTSTVSVTARPQGSLTGSAISKRGTGQLTYTSSNGGGPFTIVYQPAEGSNVTVTNVTSGSTISVTTGTPSVTTTYTLVSVTDQTTTVSRTSGFTGETATITVDQNSVTIGTQVWTDKNLDVTTYRNGDVIAQITNTTDWVNATTGAWCYYNNDPANGAIYGKLYNWYAVNDPRGLAPQGWHIPTDPEWTTLSTYLGGASVAGGKMKSTGTTRWTRPNTSATNESGFAGLPGGGRYYDGTFSTVGGYGYWWSATENNSTKAWFHRLDYDNGSLNSYNNRKIIGFSVRLVKD